MELACPQKCSGTGELFYERVIRLGKVGVVRPKTLQGCAVQVKNVVALPIKYLLLLEGLVRENLCACMYGMLQSTRGQWVTPISCTTDENLLVHAGTTLQKVLLANGNGQGGQSDSSFCKACMQLFEAGTSYVLP